MHSLPPQLVRIAQAQDGLFTRRQARRAGLSDNALQHRQGRPVQWALPTVYCATTGPLTARQRLRAAVLYGRVGGDSDVAAIGGLAACAIHGIKAAGQPGTVDLLLPMGRRLANCDFVVVRRTQRPGPIRRVSGLPVCSPARAVIDAARSMRSMNPVRALVGESVQQHKASCSDLATELALGASAGSLLARRVLAEVSDGAHSAAEAQFRRLLIDAGFPQPRWNCELVDTSGTWIARPDAYWEEASLIAEVQSREWHLSPADWAATMERTNRLSRLGLDVQQFPPSRITSDAAGVLRDLRAAYDAGLRRRQAS